MAEKNNKNSKINKNGKNGGGERLDSPPPPAVKPYKTLARSASASFVEKKSEFIGYGAPVDTEEGARAFLEASRRLHPQASHICYAYRIGADASVQRMSDAGEPSGTAGIPILETIKTRGLVNCAIGVVRYFGGVLLGAGGLARAYGHACSIALDACGVAVMEPTERVRLAIPYSLWDIVKYAAKDMPCQWGSVEYEQDVNAELRVRLSDAAAIMERLTNAADGRVNIVGRAISLEAWLE